MNQWEYYISIQPFVRRDERNIKDKGETLEYAQGNQKNSLMIGSKTDNVDEC